MSEKSDTSLDMPPDPTQSEEMTAFYAALGHALTQWAHVEYYLANVYAAVLDRDYKIAGAAFYAVENFRSKLQMVDSVVRSAVANPDLLADWTGSQTTLGLQDRIKTASRVRNNLAHFTVLAEPHKKAGKRWHLRPNIYDPMTPRMDPYNPQGGYYARDLEKIPALFGPLAMALMNYSNKLVGAKLVAGFDAQVPRQTKRIG